MSEPDPRRTTLLLVNPDDRRVIAYTDDGRTVEIAPWSLALVPFIDGRRPTVERHEACPREP